MANHTVHQMMYMTTSSWDDLRSIVTRSLAMDFTSDSISSQTDIWSMEMNDTNVTVSTTPTNTEEVPYQGYQYRPETYIVPIIFGIIFLAGLMGNGMLIAVFVKHRAMRNVPNT